MAEEFTFERYSQGLRKVLAEHSDEIAISCLMRDHSIWKISFGIILRYIEDFHIIKEKLGLRDGDRVLVLSDSTVDAFLTFLILSANHITPVMADVAIPDDELFPLIDYCRISAVFTDVRNEDKMMSTQTVPILMTYGLKTCGKILSMGQVPADKGEPTPDSVAIMFSSGTTASRKCVELSYASIQITHRKIKDLGVLYAKVKGSPMLEVFPMSHVSGLFSAFTLIYEGLCIATVEQLTSDTLAEAFKEFRPMAFGMIPKVHDMFVSKLEEGLKAKHMWGIYSSLASKSARAISKTGDLEKSRRIMATFRGLLYNRDFHCLFSGGAAATPHTAETIQNLGVSYLDLFASTECGVYITCSKPGDPMIGNGSVGNVNGDPFTKVMIHNPDQEGIGEIYVLTDQIMNGYYRDEQQTEDSYDGEYFKTGDLGRIDEDGYLYVTGRIKESIVMPNGAKVAPVDMERLLMPVMQGDINYAIAGVPSPEDGADRIHLFIERGSMSGAKMEQLESEIYQFQYKSMNQYKISGIHFIDEIPVTKIGKPKRYLLKEMVLNGEVDDVQDRPEDPVEVEEEVINDGTAPLSDSDNIRQKIFSIVKKVSGYENELTGLEDFKDDLGMDSLSIMEMCTEIESEYGISVGAYISVIPNASEMTDYVIDPIFEGLKKKNNPTKKVNAYLYPVRRKHSHRFLFNHFRKWSRNKLDFQVEGLENVQQGRQYIFCPNHQTHFDGLFVWAALGDKCPQIDRFGCLSKAEHLDSRITSVMMKTLGGIPVERTGNTIDSTQRSIDYIKEGNWFLLHPEGTRTRNGKLGAFKEGAARIALETGMTIIPVAIIGGYEIWPHDRTLPDTYDKEAKRKRTLKIVFCPEVQTVGRSPEEITREIRDKISAQGLV